VENRNRERLGRSAAECPLAVDERDKSGVFSGFRPARECAGEADADIGHWHGNGLIGSLRAACGINHGHERVSCSDQGQR